jgi:hypothetical protein
VFIMSLAMTLVYTERDPSFALTGWLWLFQATTEQLTFGEAFGGNSDDTRRLISTRLSVAVPVSPQGQPTHPAHPFPRLCRAGVCLQGRLHRRHRLRVGQGEARIAVHCRHRR